MTRERGREEVEGRDRIKKKRKKRIECYCTYSSVLVPVKALESWGRKRRVMRARRVQGWCCCGSLSLEKYMRALYSFEKVKSSRSCTRYRRADISICQQQSDGEGVDRHCSDKIYGVDCQGRHARLSGV